MHKSDSSMTIERTTDINYMQYPIYIGYLMYVGYLLIKLADINDS